MWQKKIAKQSINSAISGILTHPRSEILRYPASNHFNCDIINIHKVHDFVDLPVFFRVLPQHIPIVVTLHDLGFMTGGCDYTYQCHQFEQTCGKCPVIASTKSHDFSSEIYDLKLKAFSSRNPDKLTFVANSNWLLTQIQESSLLKKYSSQTIHYGLDTQIFKPSNRSIARKALKIPENKQIVLFSAHDVSYERKGAKFIAQALENLNIAENLAVVTFGSGHFSLPGIECFNFGRVDDERLQALFYQAADIFIIPSLEEAFGQTALEAVACGTLVVGFSVGGIPDIVVNGMNGQLVPVGDVSQLRSAVVNLLNNEQLKQQWISQASAWVNEKFSYQINSQNYIQLYNKLLK
jgi:glycosyltransferase involved in cell wall biosynthesis